MDAIIKYISQLQIYFCNFYVEYKRALIIGVGLWYVLALMQVTKLFYANDLSFKTWAVGHVPSLILMVVVFCLIKYLTQQLKIGNVFVSRLWYLVKIYLVVSAVLIFILWPGTWNWDDLWVLDGVRAGAVTAWQHVLSSYWMHMLLCILPFPGGIVLLQVVIAGFFASYSVALVEQRYGLDASNVLWKSVGKLLVFFTPPVIMYLYSGYRMGIYVFLELYVFVVFICYRKKWNEASLFVRVLTAFLVAIISTWSSESFVYMAIFGVLLLLESSMSRRERAFLILIMAFVYFGIAHDQKTKLGNDNYEIISTARPLAVAVIEANKTGGFSERDRVLIDTINKVVDVNLITSTKQDGVGLYWTGKLVRHGYTHQQYKDYLKAFFVLSTRYPKVVLRERLNTLDRSISFFKRSNVQNVLGARTLLPDNNAKKRYFAANYILAKPVLAKERMRFIDTFNIGQCKRWYQKLIYTIFWSPAPEIVLFIGLFVFFLARKMWFDGFLISGLLIRFVLVFLTSPADWYMYFHSYLFLGQFLFIMWFCKWYKERQLQRKHI